MSNTAHRAFTPFPPAVFMGFATSHAATSYPPLRAGISSGAAFTVIDNCLAVMGTVVLTEISAGPGPQTISNTNIHSRIVGLGSQGRHVSALSSEPLHYISAGGFAINERAEGSASNEFSTYVRNLYRTLQQEPVIDGFNHPGQPILVKVFENYPNAAAQWIQDHIARPSRPSTAADVLKLLCRFKPHTPVWRRDIVAAALESTSVEVRDAAIQAVESWAEPELLALLRVHSDTGPWLADYAAQIIRDIG
jgi:hypothetical protein